MSEPQHVVIVGGGATGFQTAEGLRTRGFDGAITLVEPEDGLPYDRPPLSKQFLTGAWGEERVRLRTQQVFDALRIDHRRGVRAEGVDPEAHELSLSDGSVLHYDRLVVASGASPVLPEAWRVSPNVTTLRTFEESTRLALHLRSGSSVCVIGAGMIGSEIASSARSMGLDVTLVDSSPNPLEELLGPDCAHRVMAAHREHGVHLVTGVGVQSLSVDSAESPVRVALDSGQDVVADVVVVAIGVRPNTGWLEGAGVTVADGVQCDEGCLAAEDIYAAGDVAAVHHPFFGDVMRFEQRTITTEHARVVADRLMGIDSVFEAVPYYWSDQHRVRLQGCGLVARQAESVESLRLGEAMVSLFMVGEQVRGAAVYGAPKAFPRLLKVVKQGATRAEVDEALGDLVTSVN